MKNALRTLLIVKNWSLMAAAVVIAVIVAGAFTAGPAIAQAVRAALVSNVDDPGRIPYYFRASLDLSGTSGQPQYAAAVPVGKRLVITNLSGHLSTNVAGGTTIYSYSISSSSSGSRVVEVPVTFAGSSRGLNDFVASQPILMVIDAGDSPGVGVFQGELGTVGQAIFTISGYMLDCTTGPCAPIITR